MSLSSPTSQSLCCSMCCCLGWSSSTSVQLGFLPARFFRVSSRPTKRFHFKCSSSVPDSGIFLF
ncbi:hypothetical protein CK203_021677 [Vitis vinifera]|uniref:Uncharacterized protein n=1 Tax=Vitis vinifera TaxID=29760 RepID=A0A438E5S7_VITVI|nr:hypothetical protein CK203_076347 [Vitis vinifera]RVX03937.1 hypothetical protein CK203_021677 [Vitis vinifera]